MAGPLARLGTFAHFLLALSFLPIPPIAAQAQEDLTNLPVPTITSANEGDFEAEIADTLTKSEPLKAPLLNVKNKVGQSVGEMRDDLVKRYHEITESLNLDKRPQMKDFLEGVKLGMIASQTTNRTLAQLRDLWEDVSTLRKTVEERRKRRKSSKIVENIARRVSESNTRNQFAALVGSMVVVYVIRRIVLLAMGSEQPISVFRWSDQIVDSEDRHVYGVRYASNGPFGKGGPFASQGIHLRDKISEIISNSLLSSQTPSPPVPGTPGTITPNEQEEKGLEGREDLVAEQLAPGAEWEGGETPTRYQQTAALHSAVQALQVRCEPLGSYRWHAWKDRASRIRYCYKLSVALNTLRANMNSAYPEWDWIDSDDKDAPPNSPENHQEDYDMGVKSVPSPGGGERGKELCIQALILGNARLADAMTRVSRDAILVSIETSVLPRLQRWTKQRQQLERNRQFLRRFYRIVFTLKRAGRWCVDTGKMLSKLPQRVPMLRRLSERNKKPKSKLYDIPSAYSDAMKKPKARKTETSSRAAIESDWQDRIERCEQAIEYLQTVMRQQYRALGAVHTQLWFRPELSTHLGENIGSEKLMALQNWTSKAYKVCYEALCSPVSIAQGKKSEGLAIKAESIVRKAQGYGNGVDICLKANDELRLSRWEKAERFFPTLITLLIGCALHFVMPASPAALGSILAGAYQRARSAGRAMWRRNVVRPAKAIVNDVWFQSRPKIVTPGAISDAKDSLQIMMRDFAEKAYPKMSQEELEERVQAMDMSLISGEYNKQVKNTILNLPKIPQAVLVQVQFLKVVLLATMEAIDDLYGANQINLQLLASIPALLVSFFLLRLGLRLIWVTSTRKVATAKWIHSKMRRHLREIERILLLNTGKLSLMGEGKIVFEAWRFSRTLETYWAYFPSSERASLRSDIGDLITNGMSNAEDYPIDQTLPLGLQGSQIQSINKEIFGDSIMVLGSGMDIWQRLKICERLRGSHRFLSKQSAGDSSASIPT